MTTPEVDPIAAFQKTAAAGQDKPVEAEATKIEPKVEEVSIKPTEETKPETVVKPTEDADKAEDAKPVEPSKPVAKGRVVKPKEEPKAEEKPAEEAGKVVATTESKEVAVASTKALTDYTDDELAELSEEELEAIWAQEKIQKEGQQFNEITLDNQKFDDDDKPRENYGKLFATLSTGETKEIDIKTAEFYPVAIRVQILSKYDEAEKKGEYLTPEIDNLRDEFEIVSVEGDERVVVASGDFWTLRSKYNLSTKDVFYVYLDGDFYRWRMSVGDFKVSKALKKMIGASPKPITFKVTKVEDVKKDNTRFNLLTFAEGETLNLVKALGLKRDFKFLMNNPQEEEGEETTDNSEAMGEVVDAETVPADVDAAQLPE